MSAEEIKKYYQTQENIRNQLENLLSQNEDCTYVVFIGDSDNSQNIAYIQNTPTGFVFENLQSLKKLMNSLFKKGTDLSTNQTSLKDIFQIHFWYYFHHSKELCIISAEKITKKGFFSKLTGQVESQLETYWGKVDMNDYHLIGENDERLSKLCIKSLYQEALKIFYEKTEYKKVEEHLVRCLEYAPNDIESLVLMGRCKLFLSEFEAAEDLFSKAVSLSPNADKAWLGLATAQLEIFKINPKKENITFVDSANNNADKGLLANPNNNDLYNIKGGIAMIKQNFQEAFSFFEKSYQLNPNELTSYKNQAIALMALKDFANSAKIWEDIKRKQPQDEQTAYRLIQCYFELQQMEAGQKLLDEWQFKARNKEWVEDLIACYLTEIPEEFQ